MSDNFLDDLFPVLPPCRPTQCAECPWKRTSVPGHLGPTDAKTWHQVAQSEMPVACHLTIHDATWDPESQSAVGDWSDPRMRQCRGVAIYRANVFKKPKDRRIETGPKDPDTVFTDIRGEDFLAHHKRGTPVRIRAIIELEDEFIDEKDPTGVTEEAFEKLAMASIVALDGTVLGGVAETDGPE